MKIKLRYHCCSNAWNSENSNENSIKLLIFCFNFLYKCVDLGKIFKNKFYLFSFGQSMQTIMVKVGYFCIGQRMMWDNVINLSHIFCQQVEFCKLYK
jgi:hypothetical protein